MFDMHDILYWLDEPEGITFKLCIIHDCRMEWDRCICQRCAGRPRRWLAVVNCVQLTVINSSFIATD